MSSYLWSPAEEDVNMDGLLDTIKLHLQMPLGKSSSEAGPSAQYVSLLLVFIYVTPAIQNFVFATRLYQH